MVVERFDIFKDARPSCLLVNKLTLVHRFFLQRREETLCNGIVAAVPFNGAPTFRREFQTEKRPGIERQHSPVLGESAERPRQLPRVSASLSVCQLPEHVNESQLKLAFPGDRIPGCSARRIFSDEMP